MKPDYPTLTRALSFLLLICVLVITQVGCSDSKDSDDTPPNTDTPIGDTPIGDTPIGGSPIDDTPKDEPPVPKIITSDTAIEIGNDLVAAQTSVALVFLPLQQAFVSHLGTIPAVPMIQPLATIELSCADFGGEGTIVANYNFNIVTQNLEGDVSTTGCTVAGVTVSGNIVFNVDCDNTTTICNSTFTGAITITYMENTVSISNLNLLTTVTNGEPPGYTQSIGFDLAVGDHSVTVSTESQSPLTGFFIASDPFPNSGSVLALADDGSAMRFTAQSDGYSLHVRETADGDFVLVGEELNSWPNLN